MRRLVAGVVLALAGSIIVAAPASAYERGCHDNYFRDGEVIEVYCDKPGRPRPFRVIAYCESPLGDWISYGTVGRSNVEESRADCDALLGASWVDDYRIDWL